MNSAASRDVLRDALAVIAANVNDLTDSTTLSLQVIRTRDGESLVEWIERLAFLVDVLGATAATFLDKWSDHLVLSREETLRALARELETEMTARDLADGTDNNEGNTR